MAYEILYSDRSEYLSYIDATGFEFSLNPPNYLYLNTDVFGMAPTIIQLSKAPYQDGETYIDQVFDKKDFFIELAILDKDKLSVLDRRSNILIRFNPRVGEGKLKWRRSDGIIYYLDCRVKNISFPQRGSQSTSHQIAIIEFVAPNPFWYDPTQREQYLVGFDGGWSYPWSFPRSYGTVGTTITIDNTGTVSTPVYIEFNGEVVDPVITNETTGKELKIVKTIDDGDMLLINTEFNNPYVEISSGSVKSNAMEYVDPASNLSDFSLEVGANVISYTTTSEGPNAKARFYYYHRFSGV